MEKNAEAAGITLDDDQGLESSDEEFSHRMSLQCKKLQDELNKMLADPLQKAFDRRFVTSGANSKEAMQRLKSLHQSRSRHGETAGGPFVLGREGKEAVQTMRTALQRVPRKRKDEKMAQHKM